MDVADRIVLLAGGVVEQVGSPDEIYENPANPFAMSFLGTVTSLDGHLVRPHDLEVTTTAGSGAITAGVSRVVRLGFEVRVEMATADGEVWAQLTREAADRLGLAAGDTVYVRPRAGARTLAAG